jgi:hypothetical protein
MPHAKRNCWVCSKPFTPKRNNAATCSGMCRTAMWRIKRLAARAAAKLVPPERYQPVRQRLADFAAEIGVMPPKPASAKRDKQKAKPKGRPSVDRKRG